MFELLEGEERAKAYASAAREASHTYSGLFATTRYPLKHVRKINERLPEIIAEFEFAYNRVVTGQALDIKFDRLNNELDAAARRLKLLFVTSDQVAGTKLDETLAPLLVRYYSNYQFLEERIQAGLALLQQWDVIEDAVRNSVGAVDDAAIEQYHMLREEDERAERNRRNIDSEPQPDVFGAWN